MWDIIIKNGSLISMESPAEEKKAILIKDGVIADIVENAVAEKLEAKEVIDATGLVVMPGFVDCHTHLCEYATLGVHHVRGKSQKMAAIANFLDCLKNGITTLGEHHLGHPLLSTSIESLKNIAQDATLNIKFATGTCCIGTEPLSYTSSIKTGRSLTFDDIDSSHIAKLAIESEFPGENIFLTATVANLPPHLVPNGGKRVIDKDKTTEIVDTFHSLGKQIGAHIEGSENIQMFIDCNGDVIHHAHGANTRQFEEMAQKDISLVATPHGGTGCAPNTPEEIYQAVTLGVTTAIATDSYLPVHPAAIDMGQLEVVGPKNLLQICEPTFRFLEQHGISKIDCLKLITTNAAKIMNLDNVTGSIAKLKQADIILCKGLPVFDFIHQEDSIPMVIKDGQVEVDKLN